MDDEDLDYVNDMMEDEQDDPDVNGSIDLECEQDQDHVQQQINTSVKEDENVKDQRNVIRDKNTESEMALGATSSTFTDEQMIMNNPHLRKLFNRMLDERINDAREKGESSGSELLSKIATVTEKKTTD